MSRAAFFIASFLGVALLFSLFGKQEEIIIVWYNSTAQFRTSKNSIYRTTAFLFAFLEVSLSMGSLAFPWKIGLMIFSPLFNVYNFC